MSLRAIVGLSQLPLAAEPSVALTRTKLGLLIISPPHPLQKRPTIEADIASSSLTLEVTTNLQRLHERE
jgi:hypothetical protein